MTAEANRAAQARMALRGVNVSVDKKWLESLIETVCDALQAERRAASERHEQRRADALGDQMNEIIRDYERALERGRL
jgi:hypothetical protein